MRKIVGSDGGYVLNKVYIGRGAIIGANAVVTKDVAPYSVQTGIPASEIKSRLIFDPPAFLKASNPNHLPYFYRGFDQWKFDPHSEAIGMQAQALVVLKTEQPNQIEISGRLNKNIKSINLRIKFNGDFETLVLLEESNFTKLIELGSKETEPSIPWRDAYTDLPELMKKYQILMLECTEKKSRN